MSFKWILILQWPEEGVDDLEEIESRLNLALNWDDSEIDGHDWGSGECNVFIFTNDAKATFEMLMPALKRSNFVTGLKAAFREKSGDEYTCLYPEELSSFAVK